jgi:leader peptidase (prepilin peptidase)/N-methyltransferase
MQVLLFALLGAVAGLLLDPLVVRLAVCAPDAQGSPAGEHPLIRSFGDADRMRLAALLGEQPWWRRLALLAVAVAVFAVAAARYHEVEQAAVVSAYAVVLIICAATDLIAFRVANVVTYPAAGGAVLAAGLMPGGDLTAALIGGAVAAGLMLAMAVVSRGGLGLGDVKLAGFAGLALGGPLILPALLITALAGGVAAAYLALRVRRRSYPMPYAPFISGGALAVLLWQGCTFASL